MKVPFRDERAEMLHEMLDSGGWREVAVLGLKAWKASLELRLATAITMDLPVIRHVQGQWAIVNFLLTDPRTFFGAEVEEK